MPASLYLFTRKTIVMTWEISNIRFLDSILSRASNLRFGDKLDIVPLRRIEERAFNLHCTLYTACSITNWTALKHSIYIVQST